MWERLWERHKNPFSWLLRPVFGFLMFYGAWINSWPTIGFCVFGLATSWCWFPKPSKPHAWVERFIDVEREYLTPPWTFNKVSGLVVVLVFLLLALSAFWFHMASLGLWLFLAGSLLKAVWSIKVAKLAGIPAAAIGVISALICGVLLYLY